jgi:hypothetical protein
MFSVYDVFYITSEILKHKFYIPNIIELFNLEVIMFIRDGKSM